MLVYSNSGVPQIPQATHTGNGTQPGPAAQPVRVTDDEANQAVEQLLNQKNWEGVATLSLLLQQSNKQQWERLKEQVQHRLADRMSASFNSGDHAGRGTAIAHVARYDPTLARGLYDKAESGVDKGGRDDLARGFYRGLGSASMNDLARGADGRHLLERVKGAMNANPDGVGDSDKRSIEFLENKLKHVQLGDEVPKEPTAPADGRPAYTREQADADAKTLADATWRDGDTLWGMKLTGSGWGTDESTVWKTLEPRTADDVNMIRAAYREKFDRDLDADLHDEFSGDDLDHVKALLAGGNKAGDKDPVRNADADAVAIHSEVHGVFGSDDRVLQLLEKVPYEHRKAIADAYAQRYGSDDQKKDPNAFLVSEFEGEANFNHDAMVRARGLFAAPAPTGSGAPQAMSTGDAEAAAGRLHIGLYQAGDWLPFRKDADVDTVHDVLRTHGDAGKLKMIAEAYQREYGESLEDTLGRRLEGTDKDVALSLFKRPAGGESPEGKADAAAWQADQDATRLHWAVDGAGTREGVLRSTLKDKSAEQIDAIALRYFDRYATQAQKDQAGARPTVAFARQVLRDRMEEDLGGGEKTEILHLLDAPGAADKAGQLQWQIDHDARRLKLAVDGMGTDESLIGEVLAGKSKPEIEAIAASYEKQFGHALRSRLVDETGGSREEIDLVEHSYDLGSVDLADAEAGAAELLLRVKQRNDFEKTGFANDLSRLTHGTDWLSHFQNNVHMVFHWDTNYVSDAGLVNRDLVQGQNKLESGDFDKALLHAQSAQGGLEDMIANKDATTMLAAEAVVLGVTLPIVFASGGTLTPVEAVIIGAFAGGVSAGATYATLNPQVGRYEIARHALIGMAEGATAGVPLGRAGAVTKELALATRANRQALKAPVVEGAEGAARREAVIAAGTRLADARTAAQALPNTLGTTLRDGVTWGAAGGGAYGFVDSATRHETWADGFGNGLLNVLKNTGSASVFGVGLAVPMSAGFHAALTPFRRRAETASGEGGPAIEPPPRTEPQATRRIDPDPRPGPLSGARVPDTGGRPRLPAGSGADTLPAGPHPVPVRVGRPRVGAPGRQSPLALAPFRPDPLLVQTQAMSSLLPLLGDNGLVEVGAFASPRAARRRDPAARGGGAGPLAMRVPAGARREAGPAALFGEGRLSQQVQPGARALRGGDGAVALAERGAGGEVTLDVRGPGRVRPEGRDEPAGVGPSGPPRLGDGAAPPRRPPGPPGTLRVAGDDGPWRLHALRAEDIQTGSRFDHLYLDLERLRMARDGGRAIDEVVVDDLRAATPEAAQGFADLSGLPVQAGSVRFEPRQRIVGAGGDDWQSQLELQIAALPPADRTPIVVQAHTLPERWAGRPEVVDGLQALADHHGRPLTVSHRVAFEGDARVFVPMPAGAAHDGVYRLDAWPVRPAELEAHARRVRARHDAGDPLQRIELGDADATPAKLQALADRSGARVVRGNETFEPRVWVMREDLLAADLPALLRARRADLQARGIEQPQVFIDRDTLSMPHANERLAGAADALDLDFGIAQRPWLGHAPAALPPMDTPRTLFAYASPRDGVTTHREVTLHGPGSLTEPELMQMADEVFEANVPLPDNHYGADKAHIRDDAELRDAQVRRIAEEMRSLYLVRVQQRVVRDADGVVESDGVIAGAAVTPNWRGEAGDGMHWLGHDVGEGYTYLSHLWSTARLGGQDVTEGALLAAQRELGQSRFGFYTRWNGAQYLYGSRLGGRPDTQLPRVDAPLPRLEVSDAHFTPDAVKYLRALPETAGKREPSIATLPPEVAALMRTHADDADLLFALRELPDPARFAEKVPHGVLRVSYELPLLVEGRRFAPDQVTPSTPMDRAWPPAGTVYMGVNGDGVPSRFVDHSNAGAPDLNLVPNTPEFAALRAAIDRYVHHGTGFMAALHATGVNVIDPVTGRVRASNWPVDPQGRPLSPAELADTFRRSTWDGEPGYPGGRPQEVVLMGCRLPDDYLQAFSNHLGATVYNPPDLVAVYRHGDTTRLDVEPVRPEGLQRADTDARAVPMRVFKPNGDPDAPFAQLAVPGGHLPSLTRDGVVQSPPSRTGDGFQGYLGPDDVAPGGGRLVFVNADQPHPKLPDHTTTRLATLHGPGTLDESELLRMAGEVFDANRPLPGNHYQADDPAIADNPLARERKVREIADEMRSLHLVRIHQTVRNGQGDTVSEGSIAGAALTPNWRGEAGDGAHWLGGTVPDGYTYLSHLWGKQGAGGDITEAAILAAQQHLDQSHFGFYTRWQGAQGLYGPRLGGHAPDQPPLAGARVPRLHITEASFTSDAATILRELPAETRLPPEIAALVAQSGSAAQLQQALLALPDPVRFHGQLPHKVLRASYETRLLHEGVRLHPPRNEPAPAGGTLYIGANRAPSQQPGEAGRHFNLLPRTREFAAAREAADFYTPTSAGVQVFGHAPSVYLRDPVTGRHYDSNWLVDDTGAVLSPFALARRLNEEAADGPIVIMSCRLGDDYLQALSDATGRQVLNPPDLIAPFVNDGVLRLDVGPVRPDATHTDNRALPMREFRPSGRPVDEDRFAQPVGEQGHLPTLSAPHLAHRPPVYRGDGFQGYWGTFDPANPQLRIEELQRTLHQARLAADVGDPGHVTHPGQQRVPGWRDISTDPDRLQQYGLTLDMLQPPGSRFVARLYEPEPGGPAMRPQLVFRGTARGLAAEDWANNLRNAAGRPSDYYQHAVRIGLRLEQTGVDVELVGHSLGGGLASAVALVSGRPATTFDASGLHARVRQALRDDGVALHESVRIDAYHVDGEVLTRLQQRSPLPHAEGEPNVVPGPANRITGPRGMPLPGVEPLRRHLIGSMLSGLEGMLLHTTARATPWPAGGTPVHAAGRVPADRPFARFGGTEADITAQLDRLLSDPPAHAGEIDALAREALLIQDAAGHARGDGVLPLHSRDRRNLHREFRQQFVDDPAIADVPLGLAQLDVQAGHVARRLRAELGADLRIHGGYVADLLARQAASSAAPPPAIGPMQRLRDLAQLARTDPAQALQQVFAALRAAPKVAVQRVGSWTYGPLAVVVATATQGPGFLSGNFFQQMALFNRGRTGAVNGGSAGWARMRENALRGVTNGESFDQAAVHLDRIAGWRGQVLGLTRSTVRGDVLQLRERLHGVFEAQQQVARLERAEAPDSQLLADARTALDDARAAYRATPLGSRTMAFNHPLGNPIRNLSLAVSTASIYSFATMPSFGPGYGPMGILERVLLAAPSAALLYVQGRYMFAQARSLADPLNSVKKAAETAAFWRQAWPYPALIGSDITAGAMGLTSGHYAEGLAYMARAGLNTVLWRMVMKRAQRLDPNNLQPGQSIPWWYDVPVLGKVLHPTKKLDPTVKHWTTVAVVGGLLAASATAFLAHPKADSVKEPAPPPPPDPGPSGGPTPPTDPTPPQQPTEPPPKEPPTRPPARRPPTIVVESEGESMWHIAQAHRETLLTDEHRQRIAAEGLGRNAQTVLALGELIRLNRPVHGFDPALIDGVPSARRGDPDTIHRGMQLVVGRA